MSKANANTEKLAPYGTAVDSSEIHQFVVSAKVLPVSVEKLPKSETSLSKKTTINVTPFQVRSHMTQKLGQISKICSIQKLDIVP